MASPVNYSKWKSIEVSDDEDDTHPNIHTPSLFRLRHRSRLERMAEKKMEREKLQESKKSNQQKVTEIRKKLQEAALSEKERGILNVELEEVRKQGEEYRRKEEELERHERLEPWNVDTISHDVFSKTRINKIEQAKPSPSVTQEELLEKLQEFGQANEAQIKQFAFLKNFDDSKHFLLQHQELCSEFTLDCLMVHCLNFEIQGKRDLMEHVAHQVMVMQYLIDLAKHMEVDPKAPQLISALFTRMKKADPEYLRMFEEDVSNFKEKVVKRGKKKRKEMESETEEEEKRERQTRIEASPGGLDPVEVFHSLPEAMQDCFAKKDMEQLQQVAQSMDARKFEFHMDRCVKSGLWIPDGGGERENGMEVEDAGAQGKEEDKENGVA